MTGKAGAVLLRERERQTKLLERFAQCFEDHRQAGKVEHSVAELIAQRVYSLLLGEEDLNDHDELSRDAFLAFLVGKSDLMGQSRRRSGDEGKPLASRSTLSRFERGGARMRREEKYEKITLKESKLQSFFVQAALEQYDEPPQSIVMDLDPSDVEVLLRADSGFARDELMTEVERRKGQGEKIDFVLGLPRNKVLVEMARATQHRERSLHLQTTQPALCFGELEYRTKQSWSRARRVVAKAEYALGQFSVRFLVTSLSAHDATADELYEEKYCPRGQMENLIKEQQLDLFGDTLSSSSFDGNQLRAYLSALSRLLLTDLRHASLRLEFRLGRQTARKKLSFWR